MLINRRFDVHILSLSLSLFLRLSTSFKPLLRITASALTSKLIAIDWLIYHWRTILNQSARRRWYATEQLVEWIHLKTWMRNNTISVSKSSFSDSKMLEKQKILNKEYYLWILFELCDLISHLFNTIVTINWRAIES